MKTWKYGLAVYSRQNREQHKPVIDIGSGTLPMEGFGVAERLFLDTFLKSAGERGWELVTVMEPYPAGFELTEEIDDPARKVRTFKLNDSADVQWLIFKREIES
jgi:hypothetical protein